MLVSRQAIAKDRCRRAQLYWRAQLQIVAFVVALLNACISASRDESDAGDNRGAGGDGEADGDGGDAATPLNGASGSLSPATRGGDATMAETDYLEDVEEPLKDGPDDGRSALL